MFSRNEIGDPDAVPTRAHYPWTEMEEYHPEGGMWSIPIAGERSAHITAAEQLMADPEAFKDAMRLALTRWPKSVAVALTTPGMNHRAWIGHAGCYLATGSPEDTTRLGWHQLDDGEQFAANDAADQVITEWRRASTPAPTATLFDLIPSLAPFGPDHA